MTCTLKYYHQGLELRMNLGINNAINLLHFFFVNLSLLQRNKIGLHLRLSETKEDIPPMLPRSEKQEQIRSYWAVCLGRFNYSLLVVIT